MPVPIVPLAGSVLAVSYGASVYHRHNSTPKDTVRLLESLVGDFVPEEIAAELCNEALITKCSKCHTNSSRSNMHPCPNGDCEHVICDKCWMKSFLDAVKSGRSKSNYDSVKACVRCRSSVGHFLPEIKEIVCEIVSCAGLPCVRRNKVGRSDNNPKYLVEDFDRCWVSTKAGANNASIFNAYLKQRNNAKECGPARHARLSVLCKLLLANPCAEYQRDASSSLRVYYHQNGPQFWALMERADKFRAESASHERLASAVQSKQAPINISLSQTVDNSHNKKMHSENQSSSTYGVTPQAPSQICALPVAAQIPQAHELKCCD